MKTELVRALKTVPDVFYEDLYGQDIKLKSGAVSKFYIDIKKAYGSPEVMDVICSYTNKYIPGGTNCIAAAGYGGVPLATALMQKFGYKLTLVREEPKKHGKGGWIDGYVPVPADKVSCVEDVFTTGSSLRKIINAIKPTNAQILAAIVIVKRGEGNLSDLGIPVTYLLTPEELL